jgi:hypothetical protein
VLDNEYRLEPIKTVSRGNEAHLTLTQQPMDHLCKDLPRLLLELVNYCGLTEKVYGFHFNSYKTHNLNSRISYSRK